MASHYQSNRRLLSQAPPATRLIRAEGRNQATVTSHINGSMSHASMSSPPPQASGPRPSAINPAHLPRTDPRLRRYRQDGGGRSESLAIVSRSRQRWYVRSLSLWRCLLEDMLSPRLAATRGNVRPGDMSSPLLRAMQSAPRTREIESRLNCLGNSLAHYATSRPHEYAWTNFHHMTHPTKHDIN